MLFRSVLVRFYYQYGGSASNVTCQFYFDTGFNPLGTNGLLVSQYLLTNAGVGSVVIVDVGLSTSNTPPGTYAVYGKISDGSNTRYLYAPELVKVVSNQQAPVLQIATPNPNQVLVSINGVVGQTVVLETSPDFKNWLPVATNVLTSISWSTNLPANVGRQFYRAVLGP